MTNLEKFIAALGTKKIKLQHSDDSEDLEHHGIKGMHWGVRTKGKSSGGKSSSGKPKAHDLSDEDLKKAVSRMQMEKQYNTLIGGKNPKGKKAVKAGAAFVGGIALNVARQSIQNAASSKVNSALAKKVKP